MRYPHSPVRAIKNEVEDGMELLWKKIDPSHLKPGDHIYTYRRHGTYTHHGIYIGGDYVIHYNRTEAKAKIGSSFSSVSKTATFRGSPCSKCGYDESTHRGVIRTCLDCFSREKEKLHSIRYYVYGASNFGHLLKISGTCTRLPSTRTSDEVVRVAKELLQSNGFGKYDLENNNCEHFATFCRTGVKISEQTQFYS